MTLKRKLSLLMAGFFTFSLVSAVSYKASAKEVTKLKPKQELVTKTVKIGEDTIKYKVGGKKNAKETVLLIHGALVTGQSMEDLARQFDKEQTIVLYLPGHSTNPADTIYAKNSVSEYADVVEGFIKELRSKGEITDNITVLGWSMGGSITLDLSTRNIDEIKKIVLLSSSYKWALPEIPAEYYNFGAFASAFFSSTTTQEQRDKILSTIETASVETSIKDLDVCRAFDFTDKLSEIKIPVLIIDGKDDGLALLDYQKYMDEHIANSTLYISENTNHFFPLEKPEEIANVVKDTFGLK